MQLPTPEVPMVLLLALDPSSAHVADAGGHDADEEGVNCPLHGVPTRGAPCVVCVQQAAHPVASPSSSEPVTSAPIVARRHGPIEPSRLPGALDEPTGCGHQDLGASYA